MPRHARDRPPIWIQNGARHTPCASTAFLLILLLCSASNSCLSRADGDEAARSEQGVICASVTQKQSSMAFEAGLLRCARKDGRVRALAGILL